MAGIQEEIIKCLSERRYSQGVTRIKVLLEDGCGQQIDLCFKVLKTLSTVSSLVGEHSPKELSSLLEIVNVCAAYIKHAKPDTSSGNSVETKLYAILLRLLKINAESALAVCALLRRSVSQNSPQDPSAKSIMSNCYLSLWNQSIELENVSTATRDPHKYQTVLKMRLEALKCFCIGVKDVQKFNKQAVRAAGSKSSFSGASRDDIDNYFESICKVALTKLVNVPEHDVLICWLSICTARTSFLIKNGCPEKTAKIVENIPNMKFSNHLTAVVHEEGVLVKWCMKILRVAASLNLGMKIKPQVDSDYEKVCKVLQACEKSLSHVEAVMMSADGATLDLLREVVDLLLHQGSLLLNSDKYTGSFRNIRAPALSIAKILWFRVRLFAARNSDDDGLQMPELYTMHCLLGIFNKIVMESDSDSTSIAILMSSFDDMLAAAELFKQSLCNAKHDDALELAKFDNGRVIGCIGTNLNKKELFAQGIKFLILKLSLDLACQDAANDDVGLTVLEALIKAMRKEGLLKDALKCVTRVYCVSKKWRSKSLGLWASVKHDAFKCKQRDINELTMKAVIDSDKDLKDLASGRHMYKILQDEFDAYKSQQWDCSVDMFHVMEEMMQLACVENRISILNDLTLLQWQNNNSIAKCLSAEDYCDKAIALAKKNLPSHGVNLVHSHLATAYFWKYVFQQNKAKVQAEKSVLHAQKVVPFEGKFKQPHEVDEPNERADMTAAYSQTTLKIEGKYLGLLDKSFELWTAIVNSKNEIKFPTSAFGVLKAVAEAYGLAGMDVKEILAWLAAYKMAMGMKNTVECANCLYKVIVTLVRLGFTAEAQVFVEKSRVLLTMLNSKVAEECLGLLYLHVAESELLLVTGAVSNGWKILRNTMENMGHVENDTSGANYFLRAEAYVLATKFLLLPPDIRSENCPKTEMPMDYALLAVKYSLAIQDWSRRAKSFEEQLKLPELQFKAISCVMNASLNLAQIYKHVGSMNDAKNNLKEKLLWAQKLSLPTWCVKFLLELAKFDLLSGNLSDCRVKLNGVDFIVNREGYLHPNDEDDPQEDSDVSCDFIISEPSVISTQFAANNVPERLSEPKPIKLPDGLHFDKNCRCCTCSSFTIRKLLLEFVSMRAELFTELGNANISIIVLCKIQDAVVLTNAAKSTIYGAIEDVKRKLNERKKEICFWNCQLLMQFAVTCYANADFVMALSNLKKVRKILNASQRYNGQHEKYPLLATANYYMALVKLATTSLREKIPISEVFSKVWPSSVVIPTGCEQDDELLELVNEIEQLAVNPPVTPLLPRNKLYDSKTSVKCKAPQKRYIHPSYILSSDDSDQENKLKKCEVKPLKHNVTASKSSGRPKAFLANAELVQLQMKTAIEASNCSLSPLGKVHDNRREKRIPANQPRPARRLKSIMKSIDVDTDDAEEEIPVKRPLKSRTRFPSSSSDESDVFQKDMKPIAVQERRVTRQSTRSTISISDSSKSSSCLRECDDEVLRNSSPEDVENKKIIPKIIQNPIEEVPGHKGGVISEVTALLEEAVKFIMHYPPCPLYTNVCKLLAFCVGEECSLATTYAAESVMCTMRHETINNLRKKTRAAAEKLKTAVECGDSQNAGLYGSEIDANETRYQPMMFCQNVEESRYHVNELLASIPSDWTVVQIITEPKVHPSFHSDDKNPDLLIIRYRNSKKMLLKIKGSSSKDCSSYESELNFIFNESAKNFNEVDKKTWWTVRKSLDNRLKVFLESVENVWLGPWKGVFQGKLVDSAKCNAVDTIVRDVMKNCIKLDDQVTTRERVKLLVNASPWLKVKDLQSGLAQIIGCSANDQTIKSASLSILNQKAVLTTTDERHPLVLILDKTYQNLPWESLPILRGNSAVRMPSLHILVGHLKMWGNSILAKGVNTKNAFYVLNPSKELTSTQETFEGNFNRRKWAGTSGKEPSAEMCAKALTCNDLFVYCGHGSGHQYFGNSGVSSLNAKATALLVGCSSARLNTQGVHLDPIGYVLRYMIAGCPCIVGNMWEVTDRDIDRFLMEMLNKWAPVEDSEQEKRVAKAVSISRPACQLKYMIGAAPVIYGLPIKALSIQMGQARARSSP